jgi:replicative DNA helicase
MGGFAGTHNPGMTTGWPAGTAPHASLDRLEMSADEVMERMLWSEARVDSHRARTGFLQDGDWPRLTTAAAGLEAAPLFVDESPYVSVLELRGRCRRIARRHPLGLVVVDYVQLMEPRDTRQDNRATVVAELSRGLKMLARELGVPVLACAQLNRNPEGRHDKRPLLGDLRESGALEMDADVVLMIYRDSYYNLESPDKGVAEVSVAKNRNGPVGTTRLAWLDYCMRFDNPRRVAGSRCRDPLKMRNGRPTCAMDAQ